MAEGQATARHIRSSAQKTGLVLDQIRGRDVGQALSTLKFLRKMIAKDVEKVLRSAIANAENRHNDVDVDQLMVVGAYVNEGPRMKRLRAAPMGRAYRYQRRMAHIVVEVGDGKAGDTK